MDSTVAYTFTEARTGKVRLSFSTIYQDNQEDFCDMLITHNEQWVHYYDPETKAKSKRLKRYDSPPPKKARVQPSKDKTLFTVFWKQRGVVMVDFLANRTTIIGIYKASLLKKLRKSIETERRGMLTRGGLNPARQFPS